MRICYIDDNEEYLNSFKDNFKDVFCENDFTFMQYRMNTSALMMSLILLCLI